MSRATDRSIPLALVILSSVVVVAYPLIVYAGVESLGLRGATLLMLALVAPALGARLWVLRGRANAASQERAVEARDADPIGRVRTLALIPLLTAALLAAGATLNSLGWVLAVPTVINLVLFAAFAPTLRFGPPMIERFARLIDPDLRPEEQRWCRGWTIVWSAFFVANGLVAALLAAFAPLSWWALHTSLIGYVLMGLLLATEWVFRKLRFRRFGDHALDRLLLRLTTREGPLSDVNTRKHP